jgi:hypothetical protein
MHIHHPHLGHVTAIVALSLTALASAYWTIHSFVAAIPFLR